MQHMFKSIYFEIKINPYFGGRKKLNSVFNCLGKTARTGFDKMSVKLYYVLRSYTIIYTDPLFRKCPIHNVLTSSVLDWSKYITTYSSTRDVETAE